MKRKAPTMAEKLASALLHLEAARCKLDPTLQACVDREKAKGMTPQAIIHHWEVDHYPVPVALGGSNHPTNLMPRPKAEHRHKTAKKDVPVIAKVKRAGKAHAEHVQVMAEKAAPVDPMSKQVVWRGKSKWGKQAPMPGTKASPWKKGLGKKAERREG